MKLIHYTDEPVKCWEERPYKQSDLRWQAKPNGLWVSVEGLKKYKNSYNWKEWCESEKFRVEYLSISYEVVLKKDAKILHLKTAEEIFDFTKLYPLKTRDWDADYDTYQLDWNKVREVYDGIIIAPYQWDCRLALETCWYYGWDCASGCIWNINCVEEFALQEKYAEKY